MSQCPEGYEQKTRLGTTTSGTSIWKFDVSYCKKIPPPPKVVATVEQKVEPVPAPVEQKVETVTPIEQLAPVIKTEPVLAEPPFAKSHLMLRSQLKEIPLKVYPISHKTGKSLGSDKPSWENVPNEACVKVDFARADEVAWEKRFAEMGVVRSFTSKQKTPTNPKAAIEKPTYTYKEMKVCIPPI